MAYNPEESDEFVALHEKQLERLKKRAKNPIYQKYKKIKSIFTSSVKFLFVIFVAYIILDILKFLKYETTYEITKQIGNSYYGKFEILESKVDQAGNGNYRLKDQDGIVFNARKKSNSNRNDYDEHLIKKYVLEYIQKNKLDNIIYEDIYYTINGIELLRFQYGIPIESYSQLESATTELYHLDQYIKTRRKSAVKQANWDWDFYIYIKNYTLPLNSYPNRPLDTLIYEAKIQYINYLQKNALVDEDVTQEDIQNYWRPRNMDIYINGKATTVMDYNYICTASFQPSKQEYTVNISDLAPSLSFLDKVNFFKKGIVSIVYRGKTYSITNDVTTITENKIPYTCLISDLENFFQIKVSYDYALERINITY